MSTHELLKSLADTLRESATIEKVYGEPIEAHGKTIVPVARITYGLGRGYGKAKTYGKKGRKEERPEGESGGGGIAVSPLGVFEVSGKRTSFVPLRGGKARWAGAIFVGFVLGALVGGAKSAGQ